MKKRLSYVTKLRIAPTALVNNLTAPDSEEVSAFGLTMEMQFSNTLLIDETVSHCEWSLLRENNGRKQDAQSLISWSTRSGSALVIW